MKIFLTKEQVKKIISTLTLEELNDREEYNWESWNVDINKIMRK